MVDRRGVILPVLAPILGLVGGCHPTYLLTVEDHVCHAGEEVNLVGKLEYRGFKILNKGAEDYDLWFYVDGRRLEAEDTNDEGYAKIEVDFDEPGMHQLVVALEEEGQRYVEATATVFVWRESDPILVVDIDHTVAQTQTRYLISFSGPDNSPVMPGAAEVLHTLSRSFRIVYLTGRPREMIPKTHDWLAHNGFPAGPLLTWDVDVDPWSRAEYKENRIDDLQDEFEHITIGIGDRETDHEAYRERELFSIMLMPHRPPRTLQSGVAVPDWAAIRELFARNPSLFNPNLPHDADMALPLWVETK